MHALTPLLVFERESPDIPGQKQKVAIFKKGRFLRSWICRVEAVILRPQLTTTAVFWLHDFTWFDWFEKNRILFPSGSQPQPVPITPVIAGFARLSCAIFDRRHWIDDNTAIILGNKSITLPGEQILHVRGNRWGAHYSGFRILRQPFMVHMRVALFDNFEISLASVNQFLPLHLSFKLRTSVFTGKHG